MDCMDLDKLLKRVKAEGIERCASLDTLKQLCMCFALHIPFETTDMFGGGGKVWDLVKIYVNIVEKNKGGFCCDLNGLLHWVLGKFGFEADLYHGYVCEHNERFRKTATHMLLMVTLENGDRYVVDIGWGGPSTTLPLKMSIGLVQSQPNGVYRLQTKEGLITLEKKKQKFIDIKEGVFELDSPEERDTMSMSTLNVDEEKWSILYGFKDVGYEIPDFQEGYDNVQTDSEFLVNNMLVSLQTDNGRKYLINNLFYEKEYVNPETIRLIRYKKCNLAEVYRVLKEEFGMVLDFDLKFKKFEN